MTCKLQCGRAALASIVWFATVAGTQAADVPRQFQGVWMLVEDNNQTCRAGDWPGNRRDSHVNISPGKIDFWETTCQFTAVKPAAEGGPITLTMSCRGEGQTWREANIWQIQKIRGQDLLIQVNTTRPFVRVLQKCQ